MLALICLFSSKAWIDFRGKIKIRFYFFLWVPTGYYICTSCYFDYCSYSPQPLDLVLSQCADLILESSNKDGLQ
jgi:hypothetical protein